MAVVRKSNRKNGGFTVVEMVIAGSLLVAILGAAIGMFLAAADSQKQAEALAHIQDSARNAISQIDQDIKSARAVLASAEVGETSFFSSANTIVLSLPTWNEADFVPNETDTVIYTYDSANKSLRVIVSPGPHSARPAENRILIPSGVLNCSFTYFTLSGTQKDPGVSPPNWNEVVLVETAVTLQINKNNRTYTQSLTGESRLRNWEPPS